MKYAIRNGASWSVEEIPADCEGWDTASLQMSNTGSPCISYYDLTRGALLYIHKVGAIGLSDVVDSTGGYQPALKFQSDGQPCLSYYKLDGVDFSLYYAHHDGDGWHTKLVSSDGSVGLFSSLALDHSNNPHVSCYDLAKRDLKYAYYDGVSWKVEVVDTIGDGGQDNSLTLDDFGNPYISYCDITNANLKYAHLATPMKLPSVTPESDGVGVLLFSVFAAVTCYMVIKRKAT